MFVSGLVYTFLALVSMGATIASVAFGIYLISAAGIQALDSEFDRASALLLQSFAMAAAAWLASNLAHNWSTRGLELFNSVPDDEDNDEDEEYEE